MSPRGFAMRTLSWAALLLLGSGLLACRSASAPSCQNPTPREQACSSCSASSCASEVSSVVSACPDYVSCYEACDCSDAACIARCTGDVTSNAPCLSAGSALALCVEFNCPSSQCAPLADASVDAGMPDAGSGVDSTVGCTGNFGTLCGSACVDTTEDPNNCGGCGVKCATAEACHGGMCTCSSGTFCDEACVDTMADPDNCGTCNMKCLAVETCQAGMCACPSGELCNGACVDKQTDPDNCGKCTVKCGGNETCQAGVCGCKSFQTSCSGVCVDKLADPKNCGACGTVCSASAPYCAYGSCVATPAPNCAPGGAGLTDCGPTSESCCTSLEVTGGTFFRRYDPTSPDAGVITGPDGGAVGQANPATVSSFDLDKYLVTVGRFRQFVRAWNGGAGFKPAAGSGIHTYLNGGKGLLATGVGVGDGGVMDGGTAYEQGWAAANDADLSPLNANLACDPVYATWTDAAAGNETRPINCVNWYESYAFCIWDGGFLPSEAEWGYAAAGGSEQREYPWGSASLGTNPDYAIAGCDYGSGPPDGGPVSDATVPSGVCAGVRNIAPVGTATLGAAKWGQLDMAGEVWEANLDGYADYVDPCTNCAYLGASTTRSSRGGHFEKLSTPAVLLSSFRGANNPTARSADHGFRCARSP